MILEFTNSRGSNTPVRPQDQSEGRIVGCSIKVIDDDYTAPVKKTKVAAEPIKSNEDIQKIADYLVSHKRYRDNLIFVMGINFGLRCGDLTHIKVGDIIQANQDGTCSYKEEVVLTEEKTGKTRKLYMNSSVMDALDLFLKDTKSISLNDYIFSSESNNGKDKNRPLAVHSVERMLKDVINGKLGIKIHAGTHCLRKTFAYHVIQDAPDRSRAIEFLQKILGHSSQSITLRYAGITDEEIQKTYMNLNLGVSSSEFDEDGGEAQRNKQA